MSPMMTSATDFGRVAVIMGGNSAERDISLQSGQAVLDALLAQGVNAFSFDPQHDFTAQLDEVEFDRAFIMLHGRGGEDGQIQHQLDIRGIAYTGSGVTGSEQSMDKILSKQIWQRQGLPTADFMQVSSQTDVEQVITTLGLPLFIKPVNEGSSIGMNKVDALAELLPAIAQAAEFDSKIMAERWIDGDEFTVAILGNSALPVIQLKTPNAFYDYQAKYHRHDTQYLCPSELDTDAEQYCQQLAVQAFNALGMRGWGRIDLMRDSNGQFYLLEANSIPGMTDHSLVPMAAKQAGINFNALVWQILLTSMEVDNGKEK